MAKKKPKAKLDPLLQQHQEAYKKYDKLAVEHHKLSHQARLDFAARAAHLAGIAVGDYIAIKAYGRETPMLVLSFDAKDDFREGQLAWRIWCHQVKADGTKHNGYTHRNIAGEISGDGGGWNYDAWRKITNLEVSKLAKSQRV